jgi:hypothetical protein
VSGTPESRTLEIALALAIALATVTACTPRPAKGAGHGKWDGADTSKAVNLHAGPDRGLGSCTPDPKDDHGACKADCDVGLASACVLLATRAEHDQHPSAALGHYERGCELRDPTSCVSAARMYANGVGTPRNRPKQLDLLATACRLGDTTACTVAAKGYASGKGVARDPSRAHDLWERACLGGDAAACDTEVPVGGSGTE